jgi:hypothetical protein
VIRGPGDRIGVDVGGMIVGVGRQEQQLRLFGNLGMAGITHYRLITNDDGLDLVGGVTTSNTPFILLLSGRVLE